MRFPIREIIFWMAGTLSLRIVDAYYQRLLEDAGKHREIAGTVNSSWLVMVPSKALSSGSARHVFQPPMPKFMVGDSPLHSPTMASPIKCRSQLLAPAAALVPVWRRSAICGTVKLLEPLSGLTGVPDALHGRFLERFGVGFSSHKAIHDNFPKLSAQAL
jgi:hypothetical protein